MTTRAAVALSEEAGDRAAGSAVGAAVAAAVGDVLPRRLALLAVAGGRDPSEVCRGLREALGGVPVLGFSTPDVSAGEASSHTGVGLLLLAGTHTRVTTAAAGGWREHPTRTLGQLFGELRRQRGGATQQYLARSLLVFSDTPLATGQRLVDAISQEEGLGFVVLGAALDSKGSEATGLMHGETPMNDGVVAAEILADRQIGVFEAHSYRLGDKPLRVTASTGPRVHKIDDLDAARFASPEEEEEVGLTLATLLADGNQRLLGGVSPVAGGTLECPGSVAPGSRAWLARFDPTSHPATCQQVVDGAVASLASGVRPAALLAIRPRAACPRPCRHEADLQFRAAAGEIPLLGFEAGGAMARLDGSVHSFHTASYVVCAFPGG